MTGDADLRAQVGDIAHKLQNHLTVVIGHAELARAQVDRAADGPGARDGIAADLDAIAAASERIGELGRRLRDLAETEG